MFGSLAVKGCLAAGIVYKSGDKFIHPSSDCDNCVCNEGNIECSPIICPKLSCPLTTVPERSCCPACRGN